LHGGPEIFSDARRILPMVGSRNVSRKFNAGVKMPVEFMMNCGDFDETPLGERDVNVLMELCPYF
jgi:hypothetical protein